jgi:hypothetical protein
MFFTTTLSVNTDYLSLAPLKKVNLSPEKNRRISAKFHTVNRISRHRFHGRWTMPWSSPLNSPDYRIECHTLWADTSIWNEDKLIKDDAIHAWYKYLRKFLVYKDDIAHTRYTVMIIILANTSPGTFWKSKFSFYFLTATANYFLAQIIVDKQINALSICTFTPKTLHRNWALRQF